MKAMRLIVQRDSPEATDYRQVDQRTHCLISPDMYIGGTEPDNREEWVYDLETDKMVLSHITVPQGVERLFLEILSNCADNVGRSRRSHVDPGVIEVAMSETTISVTNGGMPIPVEIHPEHQVYVPQMIFGSLLTSSNFEVERHEAGRNGIGAKVCNIFSTSFMVIIHDAVHHLSYTGIWRDNMGEYDEPVIEPFPGKVSSVQIVYDIDFARFGYVDQYPPEVFKLFARHCADVAFTAKVPVRFNDREFNCSSPRDYARLYFGEVVDSSIVYYAWPPGTEVVNKKGVQQAKDGFTMPTVELVVLDTPDAGHSISFANSMMTRDGGAHVTAAIKAVTGDIIERINGTSKTTEKATKKKKAKPERKYTINVNDVKPHISILLSCRLVNPKFTSQSKTMLASPTPKIEIGEEILKPISHWQLINRLYATLEAKQFNSLLKTDGKKKRHVALTKGRDANDAGGPKSHECVLIVTEGDSAMLYANKLIGLIPNGNDRYGVLPLRGKGLNVTNASYEQIEKNKVIKELKIALGLQEETDYTLPENFSHLRYGMLMIMSDADDDGDHIKGLTINYFHIRHPSLLSVGYIAYWCTPILRVSRGKESKRFYSVVDYEAWKAETPNWKDWTHKYFKGLGTSKDLYIKEDFEFPREVVVYYDADAAAALRLAFDAKLADQRKEWIAQWSRTMGFEGVRYVPVSGLGIGKDENRVRLQQPVSWFVNNDLIRFSMANVQRMIPRLEDGLKLSQRKVLYGVHLKFKVKMNKKKAYGELKVAQLSNFIAEKLQYHHGEVNLDDVIIRMAHDFVGSNNLPYFTQDGQFGARTSGSKVTSQSRYLYTRPQWWLPYVYRREDNAILRYLEDEGVTIEPEVYLPIIPMALINGVGGIGTGHSTTGVNHNPLDIIAWLRARINNNEEMPPVLPWYRGFTGAIQVIDRTKRKGKMSVTTVSGPTVEMDDAPIDDIPNDEEEEGVEAPIYIRPLLSMISLGEFQMHIDGTIVITELPVGKWTAVYRAWLDQAVEDKEIASFRDLSDDFTVRFEIKGYKGKNSISHKALHLEKSYTMSNMVFLDQNNRPCRYDTVYEVLEAFYNIRLDAYGQRRAHIIAQMVIDIEQLQIKRQFIQDVVSERIVVFRRRKDDIIAQMESMGYPDPKDLYSKTRLAHCNEEEIQAMDDEIAQKIAAKADYEAKTSEQIWLQELDEFEAAYRKNYSGSSKIKMVVV